MFQETLGETFRRHRAVVVIVLTEGHDAAGIPKSGFLVRSPSLPPDPSGHQATVSIRATSALHARFTLQ